MCLLARSLQLAGCLLALCIVTPALAQPLPPPPPLKPRAPGHVPPGAWREGMAGRGLALMNAADHVTPGADPSWIGVAQLATIGVGDMQLLAVSTRHRDFAALGVSTEGIAGALEIDSAFGVRPTLVGPLAAVARLGLRLQLLGDASFYSSLFDLPQAQLGLRLATGRLALELGGRAGYAIAARLRLPGEAADADASFDLGGYLDARYAALRMTLAWSRIFGSDSELPRFAQADLCVDTVPGACVRARGTWYPSADPAAVAEPTAVQLGLLLTWMDVELR